MRPTAPVPRDGHRGRTARGGIAVSTALVCSSLASACGSNGDLDARLATADSVVEAWTADERVPGAVLHVSVDGRTVLERAYGAAALYEYGEGQYPASAPTASAREAGGPSPRGIERLDAPRPMKVETVFDLASVTKVAATTLAVMLLVDRGELEVDAPVSAYLPDFVGDGREAITVRHLLTHRSGLRQWWPLYYRAATPDEAYALVRDMPLEWPVGAERHYSDLGFMVLGRVVERVSGASLGDFVGRELYAPLGMMRTGFRLGHGEPAGPYAATSHGNPFERRMVYDADFGYRIDIDPEAWDGWRRRTVVGEVSDGNAFHAFGGVAGHAGLFSTAAELDVLLRLLLEGGIHGDRRILSQDVVDLFLTPTGDDQALGWELPPYSPPGSFGHEGFTGTFVLGVPERGLALVLLTNRENVGLDSESAYPDVGPLQREVTAALTAPR